jgi:acyl-homoserine lactone acylase PvdQ
VFTLAGAYPRPWTPVDSLVIQGVLTQEPDYPTAPLDYAILQHSQGSAELTSTERSVLSSLRSWNFSMAANSTAATAWWTFWTDYLSEVFKPWWKAGHVPVGKDSDGLAVGPDLVPLDEDLQAWTLTSPGNPAFRGPSGRGFAGAAVETDPHQCGAAGMSVGRLTVRDDRG